MCSASRQAASGQTAALYSFMQFFSAPVLGALSDRHGQQPVLLLCLLGTAIAYLTALGLADSLWVIYLAIIMDGITGGNLTTAYAYIADVTTPENRARNLGLVGAAFGLGLMAGDGGAAEPVWPECSGICRRIHCPGKCNVWRPGLA